MLQTDNKDAFNELKFSEIFLNSCLFFWDLKQKILKTLNLAT